MDYERIEGTIRDCTLEVQSTLCLTWAMVSVGDKRSLVNCKVLQVFWDACGLPMQLLEQRGEKLGQLRNAYSRSDT